MPARTRAELEQVAEKAVEQFWSHVAAMLPEIKSGDVEPMMLVQFKRETEYMVEYWFTNNGGKISDA